MKFLHYNLFKHFTSAKLGRESQTEHLHLCPTVLLYIFLQNLSFDLLAGFIPAT